MEIELIKEGRGEWYWRVHKPDSRKLVDHIRNGPFVFRSSALRDKRRKTQKQPPLTEVVEV